MRAAIALVLLAAVGTAGSAQTARRESPAWSVFNRTPRAEAREMSTDRPDRTESPFTVPAGWVQAEIDLVSYTRDVAGGMRTGTLAVSPVNLKLGLLHGIDVQFVAEPYVRDRVRDLGTQAVASTSGTGAFTGRLKVNLWGNDGGRTALALMPFVSLDPSWRGRGRDVNGGLIVPLAVDLGGDWGLGLMAELDLLRTATGTRAVAFVQTATVGRPLAGALSGYAELFSQVQRGAPWVATADAGLTYGLTGDIQLDGGVNVGVTDAAEDLNPFLGLTVRF